jgi:hypothetical protein
MRPLVNGKITKDMAQEIINLFVEGKTARELANLYNISPLSVTYIINSKTWKECNRPENIESLLKRPIT